MTIAEKNNTSQGSGSVTPELCDILLAGLRALADDGDADLACRLAGRACAVLRQRDDVQWRRFNVLLHRLIPKTGPVGIDRLPLRVVGAHARVTADIRED